MIHNPIIHKEVLSALRTRKATFFQALFLLISAALVWLLWPADGMQAIGGQQAKLILSVLAVGEIILVALFAPAFTAASLTTEQEHNTLESLFTTRLRPWEIATGKMVGSLIFLVLLVLCGVPALAMPFLLGGVDATQVLAVLGVLLLTAVYLGMIGLLVSSFMHRSYRAIIVTYGVLLFVCLLVAVPAWPLSGNMISRGGAAWQWTLRILASFSPLEAMFSIVFPDSAYSAGSDVMPDIWQLFIPTSCLVILVTAAILLYRLRRPAPPPRPREKLKIVERGQISARTFLFLIDPRKRKKMIRRWQNPVLIKEFRTRPMLQAQWLLRAVGLCLIISILLMMIVSISVIAYTGESGGKFTLLASAVATLMIVLLVLVGPAMTSGTICSDRETGVWDMLRMTRLSSWQIVSGKFQASIIPLLLFTLAMLPALLILLYFNLDLWLIVLRVLSVVGMTVLFVATAGMFFSSLFNKTSTATAWTYALLVVLVLLTLLVLLAEDLFSRRFIQGIFVVNPVAAALKAAGHPAMQKFSLVWSHHQIMGTATAVMLFVTVVRVFQLRRAD